MYSNRRFSVVFILFLLATLNLGSSCGSKNVCDGIQKYNFKAGQILTAAWKAWESHYKQTYTEVVGELMVDYSQQMTSEVIDELLIGLDKNEVPDGEVAAEIYNEYKSRMSKYDDIGDKLERSLSYTGEAAEILEHAMISCQSFTDKEIIKAIIGIAQGLAEAVDIMKESGMVIPSEVTAGRETAEEFAEKFASGESIF